MPEIRTTTAAGVPVRATGRYVRCSRYEYPGCDYIDDLEVEAVDGSEIELSDGDDQRIVNELCRAHDTGAYEWLPREVRDA